MANGIQEITVIMPAEGPGDLITIGSQSIMGITAILPDGSINQLSSLDQNIAVSIVLPVEPAPPSLAVAYVPVMGPPGPPGPPGPSGTGDKTYLHTQNAPSDTWVINHNLDKYPSIEVLDSAGTVVMGAVNYIDTNTAIVTFSTLFGGTATCN